MANNISIELLSQPSFFEGISFTVNPVGSTFTKTIFKRFASSPLGTGQVAIGADLFETVQNLYNNLIVNDADAFVNFVLDGSIITLDFNQSDNYEFVRNNIIREAVYELQEVSVDFVVVPSVDYFPYESFAIIIVDTYENDREMIEEFTQVRSPKIKWDAGDDLYQSIMASELNFNMMVNGNEDAKFKHLFTGDEKRYLVKLLFVNDAEEVSLAWQGYLLPDQFKEPYKNGVNFIEFTATDMIGSLKGKYLPPWFYKNRLPIAELIAEILKLTGLSQEILVKPSIVPNTPFVQWKDINVNLEPYFDGKKYTDVYEILVDVLEAQLLTIYSYKGFWWLDGLTRKRDSDGSLLSFTPNGVWINEVRNFNKQNLQALFERDVPMLSGVTPWKQVQVDFETKSDKNIFSDDVVKKEIFLTVYVDNLETAPLNGNAYRNTLLQDWIVVGCPELIYRTADRRKFSEALHYSKNVSSFSFTSSVNLNYQISNYFQCPENPYLLSGVEYELDFEALCIYRSVYLPDGVSNRLQAKKFDSLFRFQMFVNDVLVLTNVPELSDISKFIYDRSNEFVNNDDRLTFKAKAKFKLNESGPVVFRILHPRIENADDFARLAVPVQFVWNVLKINVIDDVDFDKTLIASRDINFTQIYNADLQISASEDVSVENSFGIGAPTNQRPYIFDIPTDGAPLIYNDIQLFPTGIANVQLQTFTSNFNTRHSLFVRDFRLAVFKEKLNGVRTLFGNLWVRTINSVVRLGYIIDYSGNPILPKNYDKIGTLNPTDVLKYMQVVYQDENIQNRNKWRLFEEDFSETNPYNIVFAKAIHAVQPETMYRLEGNAMHLIFPDTLIDFYFDNESRSFIPTTITLDLSAGKTQIVATESKFSIPNDLTYE
jgi:hypothetical protein